MCVKEGETTLTIDWKSLKIPCIISGYNIPNKVISFSSISLDVLYMLTRDDEIFSLHISSLTLTKMVVSGLQSGGHIQMLQCHDGLIYIVQWFAFNGSTIYKCIIDDNISLRAIGSYTHNSNGLSFLFSKTHSSTK